MHHRLEEAAGVVVADVLDRAGERVPGVVDQAVERPAGEDLLAALGIGHVEQHGLYLDACLIRRRMHHLCLGGRADRSDRVEPEPSQLDHRGQSDA